VTLSLVTVLGAGSVRAAGPTPPPAAGGSAAPTGQPAVRLPVMAYYYMWFAQSSWTRAKTDLPDLGAYNSTDHAVIAQHVAWARAAGVDVFIASWKNTPGLDLALSELVAESHRQGLKLVLIYEGLDVNRNPIPAATVSADISWFFEHYGSDSVFDVFGKPAVIWSGTWKFSSTDVASVRAAVGAPNRLLLLGSETSAADYQARATLFDGDAYYWSSGDPLSTPGYQKRLGDLATAVHSDRGLWLAPATVGFDARLNGGASVVDRRNGQTLTQSWADAIATKPDGIAVISWNEYTENSYLEPSQNYGYRYLDVLGSLTGAPSQTFGLLPSSSAVPSPSARTVQNASPSATPSEASRDPNSGAPPGNRTSGFDASASILVAAAVLIGLFLLGLATRRRPGNPSDE
jgi:hypothetical protein